jgi:hypothetical protein
MSTQDPWAQPRHLRRVVYVAFGVWFVGWLTPSVKAVLLQDSLAFRLAMGYLAVTVILWIRYMRFDCPRCRQRFFGTTLRSSTDLRRTCAHCGLRWGAKPETWEAGV